MERILTKYNLITNTKKPASDTHEMWAFMKLLNAECDKVNRSDIVVDYAKLAESENLTPFKSFPSLALTPNGKIIGIVTKLEYRLHDFPDRTSSELPYGKQTASNLSIARYMTNLRVNRGQDYFACKYVVFEAYGLKDKDQLEYLGRYCLTDKSPFVKGGIYVDAVHTVDAYQNNGVATTLQQHAFEYVRKHKLELNDLEKINIELDCVSSVFAKMLYKSAGFIEDEGMKKLYGYNYPYGSRNIPLPLKKVLHKDDDYSNKLGCPLNAIKPRLHNKIRIMDNEYKIM